MYKEVRITSMKAATAEVPTSKICSQEKNNNKKQKKDGLSAWKIILLRFEALCLNYARLSSSAVKDTALRYPSSQRHCWSSGGGKKYPVNPLFNNTLDWNNYRTKPLQ